MTMKSAIATIAVVLSAAACGDSGDPTQVIAIDPKGSYDLSVLAFDPQGILPQTDLKSRITESLPRLTIANNGQAQLVFTDPETSLVTVSNATYVVTNAGEVRLDFGTASTVYRKALLSRIMTFSYTTSTKTLTFTGPSPDGVTRSRLVQLVPEWANEQLLDPVPGTLTIQFRAQ